MVREGENLEFSEEPLEAEELRWIRARRFKEQEKRKQWQAWITIPPSILAIFSTAGLLWAWFSGLFNK